MIADAGVAVSLLVYAAIGFSMTGAAALLWLLWKGRRR